MHLLYPTKILSVFIPVVLTTPTTPALDIDKADVMVPGHSPTTAPPRAENPFIFGFVTAPESCTDFRRPSKKCIDDMQAQPPGPHAFSGGEMKWDSNHTCNNNQKAQFQTAVWDAHSLATFANAEPDEHNAKHIALWNAWMGPDYRNYQQRISNNLKRASNYQAQKSFDIILSCNDPNKTCEIKRDGKAVGGFARTYHGWFGHYYYITMCLPFFLADSLMSKVDQIMDDLRKGELKMAQQASWQMNTGQFFLHEMMHLESVGDPHIKDERVEENDLGPWAYGPGRTHQLAKRKLNQGGGANRSSTNADSYAWLANSKYFFDLTGHWPQPDYWNGEAPDTSETHHVQLMMVNLGIITADTTDEEIQQRLNSYLDDSDPDTPPSPGPPPTSAPATPPTSAPAPPPPPPPPSPPPPLPPLAPVATCVYCATPFFYEIMIFNIQLINEKDLLKQEKGCGRLTGWRWDNANPSGASSVTFNLPLIIKAGCIERAIKSAGGPKISCKKDGMCGWNDAASVGAAMPEYTEAEMDEFNSMYKDSTYEADQPEEWGTP